MRTSLFAAFFAFGATVLSGQAVFTILANLDATSGTDPLAALLQAYDGDLYGTTVDGGANATGGFSMGRIQTAAERFNRPQPASLPHRLKTPCLRFMQKLDAGELRNAPFYRRSSVLQRPSLGTAQVQG